MFKVGQTIISNIDGSGIAYPSNKRPIVFTGMILKIKEKNRIFVQRDDGITSDLKGNDGLWELHYTDEVVTDTLRATVAQPFILLLDEER